MRLLQLHDYNVNLVTLHNDIKQFYYTSLVLYAPLVWFRLLSLFNSITMKFLITGSYA